MNTNALTAFNTTPPVDKAQLKTAGAAKDFEALLVGQMLRSVREEGSGWMGTGEDQASSAAFGLGEEQLARSLSAHGDFGLTAVIEKALNRPGNSGFPISEKG